MKMTNEQIKEVLDAFDRGEKLEYKYPDRDWIESCSVDKRYILINIAGKHEYRIKPNPKVVEGYSYFENDYMSDIAIDRSPFDTHKITYELDENNEPILGTFKIEKL